jgi:hypothetical protein
MVSTKHQHHDRFFLRRGWPTWSPRNHHDQQEYFAVATDVLPAPANSGATATSVMGMTSDHRN